AVVADLDARHVETAVPLGLKNIIEREGDRAPSGQGYRRRGDVAGGVADVVVAAAVGALTLAKVKAGDGRVAGLSAPARRRVPRAGDVTCLRAVVDGEALSAGLEVGREERHRGGVRIAAEDRPPLRRGRGRLQRHQRGVEALGGGAGVVGGAAVVLRLQGRV